MTPSEDLAAQLRAAIYAQLKRLGMTQHYLARHVLGISPKHLNQALRGKIGALPVLVDAAHEVGVWVDVKMPPARTPRKWLGLP